MLCNDNMVDLKGTFVDNGNGELAFTSDDGSVKAVSYTHLDVYKRQVRNRTKQAVKKNRILLFHWRGGYLTCLLYTSRCV